MIKGAECDGNMERWGANEFKEKKSRGLRNCGAGGEKD